MVDVSTIINSLGGNAAVARRIGLGASGVSEMKRRGNIPVDYWKPLMDMADELGIGPLTADILHAAHLNHGEPEGNAA